MLGLISCYTAEEHTIIRGGELSGWLERLTDGRPNRKNRLFLIRYNALGVFVIAEWTDNHKDTFTDVLNLGKSLGNFGQKEAQELRRRLFAPVTAEDTAQAINRTDSDFYHGLQDEDLEETERQERVAIGE